MADKKHAKGNGNGTFLRGSRNANGRKEGAEEWTCLFKGGNENGNAVQVIPLVGTLLLYFKLSMHARVVE